jgi:hypothetical protein
MRAQPRKLILFPCFVAQGPENANTSHLEAEDNQPYKGEYVVFCNNVLEQTMQKNE